jgi:hypothetical protein
LFFPLLFHVRDIITERKAIPDPRFRPTLFGKRLQVTGFRFQVKNASRNACIFVRHRAALQKHNKALKAHGQHFTKQKTQRIAGSVFSVKSM